MGITRTFHGHRIIKNKRNKHVIRLLINNMWQTTTTDLTVIRLHLSVTMADNFTILLYTQQQN